MVQVAGMSIGLSYRMVHNLGENCGKLEGIFQYFMPAFRL
jgi:hypothetical protein